MKNIRLGRSELEVSRIAFGTWQLGGDWGTTGGGRDRRALAAPGGGGLRAPGHQRGPDGPWFGHGGRGQGKRRVTRQTLRF